MGPFIENEQNWYPGYFKILTNTIVKVTGFQTARLIPKTELTLIAKASDPFIISKQEI